jgi:hypothetical protein
VEVLEFGEVVGLAGVMDGGAAEFISEVNISLGVLTNPFDEFKMIG